MTTVENKIPDVNSLVKKQIITLKLLRLILSYQALMVKLLKIKMSLIRLQKVLHYLLGGNMLFNSEDSSQTYLIFQPYRDILKRLPILIIFYYGNLENYLLKVLSHLRHLIIVLIQN